MRCLSALPKRMLMMVDLSSTVISEVAFCFFTSNFTDERGIQTTLSNRSPAKQSQEKQAGSAAAKVKNKIEQRS